MHTSPNFLYALCKSVHSLYVFHLTPWCIFNFHCFTVGISVSFPVSLKTLWCFLMDSLSSVTVAGCHLWYQATVNAMVNKPKPAVSLGCLILTCKVVVNNHQRSSKLWPVAFSRLRASFSWAYFHTLQVQFLHLWLDCTPSPETDISVGTV